MTNQFQIGKASGTRSICDHDCIFSTGKPFCACVEDATEAIAELNEIEGYIDDPATIPDHETALRVIEAIDETIASIQSQLDTAMALAASQPMSSAQEDWFRRASYARAMEHNRRHKIYQRDREFRGTVRVAILEGKLKALDPDKKAERAAKQERLMAEAEARKASKQAEHAKNVLASQELAYRRSLAKAFMDEARRALDGAQFNALVEAAKRANSG